jgi:hypothetical protein
MPMTPPASRFRAMRLTRTILMVGVLCLPLSTISPAAEWTSAEFNCAIVFPDSLQQTPPPQPSVKATARSSGGDRFIIVSVLDPPQPGVDRVDRQFLAGARDVILKNGGEVASDRLLENGGVPACELVSRVTLGGKPVSMKTLSLVAEGKMYSVQAISATGDVAADSELTECLRSFRFLRPPKIPNRFSVQASSSAYRTGLWTGRLAPTLLLVLLVIYAIKRSSRKKQRPLQPPPLPHPGPPPLPPRTQ